MRRSGLRPAWQRWIVVVLGVAALASLPTAIAVWPAKASDVSAAELLASVQVSGDAHYSGYAESRGGLVLPVTDEFTDVVDLFGQTSRMRVWWRTAEDWRVDTITASGETDLFHRAGATVYWDYESNSARLALEPDLRLPRTADLLPSVLGQRLLSEATAAEMSRLPERRIAGRTALGLRLTPADERTTIVRVDLWVDPGTGVPLRVDVAGASGPPAVTTTFLDFNSELPDGGVTGFV
ncbi:MAG: transcriptional regulator, partial [Geodermatophilaceae bacterium]|nr:transcriptional regulator [Geodermatophilaceae bacterium]